MSWINKNIPEASSGKMDSRLLHPRAVDCFPPQQQELALLLAVQGDPACVWRGSAATGRNVLMYQLKLSTRPSTSAAGINIDVLFVAASRAMTSCPCPVEELPITHLFDT